MGGGADGTAPLTVAGPNGANANAVKAEYAVRGESAWAPPPPPPPPPPATPRRPSPARRGPGARTRAGADR